MQEVPDTLPDTQVIPQPEMPVEPKAVESIPEVPTAKPAAMVGDALVPASDVQRMESAQLQAKDQQNEAKRASEENASVKPLVDPPAEHAVQVIHDAAEKQEGQPVQQGSASAQPAAALSPEMDEFLKQLGKEIETPAVPEQATAPSAMPAANMQPATVAMQAAAMQPLQVTTQKVEVNWVTHKKEGMRLKRLMEESPEAKNFPHMVDMWNKGSAETCCRIIMFLFLFAAMCLCLI